MYYFCNFMEKSLKGNDERGMRRINISDALDSVVQPAKCYKVGNELNFVTEGEQSKGVSVDFLGKFSASAVGSTDLQLESTDENPIIIIATKKFEVYTGIPSYIKYFPIDGGVLVVLIKGYISVETKEGDMLPLTRNCDVVSSCKGHTYSAEDMKKLNIIEDKESGVRYSDFVVSDCVITHTVLKGENELKSVKYNRENFVILNEEVFIEARERKKIELEIEKEESRRKAEKIANFNIAYKARMEREAKVKETPTKRSVKTEVVVGSEGAKSFLDCLAKLKTEA